MGMWRGLKIGNGSVDRVKRLAMGVCRGLNTGNESMERVNRSVERV